MHGHIRNSRRAWSAALLAFALTDAAAVARAQGPPPAGAPPGTVSGRITDAESGAAVATVRVRLPALHREELAHDDGAFTFAGVPPGRHELLLQRVGYAPLRRSVELAPGAAVALELAMFPTALELAPTVVTGTLDERAGEEVLSPASVVSSAELARRMEGTVAGTLRREPGVAITTIGPSTGRPVIRGLSGDRILVLEDGLRPGDLSSTSGDHAVAVEPLTAKQLEVVRGPMSLLYGSSALGGVVNVVRDEVPAALPEHTHGVATAQGSSADGSGTGGGYVTTAMGRVALRAEGSIRGASDIRTPRGELENTNARTYNLSAGAAYVGDWGHAGGSYRYYDSDYGIPGGFVGGHPRGVDIVMRRHMGRLEGELHPAQGGVLERVRVSAAYTDYRHRELERRGAVGTAFDQELAAVDVQARHGAMGPFSLGAVGARAQYRDVTTGGTLRTPSTYDYTFAGYAVEELGRGPFRVQLGARYDWARYVPRDLTASIRVGGRRVPVRPRTFGSASGSLGALYAVAEGVRVGVSVSRAYRTPDFNELYSDGPHLAAGSFDVGDPELGEETGVGMDAFLRIATRQLRGELAAFRNRLDDYIYPSSRGRAEVGTSGGRPRLQFTNADALFTGAEGDVEWSVTRALVVEATVSYVRAEFVSPGDSIPLFEGTDTTFIAASRYPPLIPPLRGHLGVRFERPRWFAGIGARWADRQDRIGDFERPTAGYAVGEVSGGLRLLAGSRLHTVTLRVDNVTDREYREHLSRTKEIMPEPGRSVSLLYRLTF